MIYETFIKLNIAYLYDTNSKLKEIKNYLKPIQKIVENNDNIYFFNYLIHGKRSGVPCRSNNDLYLHIRIFCKKELKMKKLLPKYCKMTRLMPIDNIMNVKGFNIKCMKSSIEFWHMLSLLSNSIIDILNKYKGYISTDSLKHILHYIDNMLGMPSILKSMKRYRRLHG